MSSTELGHESDDLYEKVLNNGYGSRNLNLFAL